MAKREVTTQASGVPPVAMRRKKTQPQSKIVCRVCGYTGNADAKGARNIVAAGYAVLARRGMVQPDRPLKQEPTEVSQSTA